MILRRIGEAVRRQDWFTVLIEFVIVVAGVFFAMQANTWAEERGTRVLYRTALSALLEESAANRAFLDERIADIEADLPTIEEAVVRLNGCQDGPDPEALINAMIEMSYSNIAPHQGFAAYESLTSNPRFREVMAPAFQQALSVYDRDLYQRYLWLVRNARTVDPGTRFEQTRSVTLKTYKGAPSGRNAARDVNTDLRFHWHLGVPVSEACQDHEFIRDAMNFYAIHFVNLRISRKIQADRDLFEGELQREIDNVR